MVKESLLYPETNAVRTALSLDGLWDFEFDPKYIGNAEDWPEKGLPDPISMPVPASFSDFFTDRKSRDYTGDFWYSKKIYVPANWEGKVYLRFGSLTHTSTVYCNGKEVATHKGGFLPVVADITDVAKIGGENLVVVKLNNELSETMIPCGAIRELNDGSKISKPYFDFYNYSGIQRTVSLVNVPVDHIKDYSTAFELGGNEATVTYTVETTTDKYDVEVRLVDENSLTVATAEGREGTLVVKNPTLWEVRNAYLYDIIIDLKDGERLVDTYTAKLGIRTVEVDGIHIKVNGKPVYLKGFGKHEDADIIGRGFSYPIAKRDFELMKWIGANCFRTSHYPYSDEWYQMADREGFLIIDEVPAVGMFRSIQNFALDGVGTNEFFFKAETVPALKENHLEQMEEMMNRDKNHPSVIAWSLFNEPETTNDAARAYFTDIFNAARKLDPQKRPLTGALIMYSTPQTCKCYDLCDFISLNRYYGWYIDGGSEMGIAMESFRKEMDAWAAKDLNRPFIFTEFGADTLASEHKLPSVMWSQEYQDEYIEMTTDVIDSYDFVQGELVWNFADFQTTEGIMRVNGNKKGIFTRQRQPKSIAYLLKKRWEHFPGK